MRPSLITALTTALALLGGCAVQAPVAVVDGFPPLDSGPSVHLDGTARPTPPACPAAGSVVERDRKPRIEYIGPDPSDPELCRVRVAGQAFRSYFGIWNEDWPGAAAARDAFRRVIQGPPGTTVTFDVRMMPGMQWHDSIRNDGIEDLSILGQVRPAIKLSHYREGFDGNGYRSVVTGWKDIRTGMILYVNYHHISGHPEAGVAWDPTAIIEPH